MARVGITEFQVFKAADELALAAGAEPSNRDVLEKLGSGSMTTITTHMKRWRELHPQYQAQSEGFSDPLLNAVHVLRATLLDDAQKYVDEQRIALDEKLQQAIAHCERAQQSYVDEAAVTQKLHDELSNTHTQLATYRLDLKTETERRVRAETASENLATQLADLHQKFETLSADMSNRDHALAQSTVALAEREATLQHVKKTLATTAAERQSLSLKIDSLNQEISGRQSELDKLVSELAQCHRQLTQHTESEQHFMQTIADLTNAQREWELRLGQLMTDKALMHDRAEYLREQLSEERHARTIVEQELMAERKHFEKQLIELAEKAQNTVREKALPTKTPKRQ